MLLLTILILSLLALVNYRIGGKAILYPPVVFCGMFAFDLCLVWAVGQFFYPMLPQTLFILLAGGFAFSIGCWIAMLLPEHPPAEHSALLPSSQRIITVLVIVSAVTVPFFFRWLAGVVAMRGAAAAAIPFLAATRMGLQDLLGTSPILTLFGALVEISMIVALIAFYEGKHHRKRTVIAITAALVLGLLMGAKSGPLAVVVGLLCIDWIRNRRLRWKLVLVMAMIFAAITATVEFYVHLGGDSISEKAVPVAQNFALYASGGIVALDRLVREPSVAPPINQFSILYLHIARRLGAHVDVHEAAQFVNIGPHDLTDNVYTIYWSYLELGYFGAIACTGFVGFLLTLIYKRALLGFPLAILFYAFLFRGLVFAPFNEQFVLPYFQLKIFLVWILVYAFPPRWAQFKRFVETKAAAELAARP